MIRNMRKKHSYKVCCFKVYIMWNEMMLSIIGPNHILAVCKIIIFRHHNDITTQPLWVYLVDLIYIRLQRVKSLWEKDLKYDIIQSTKTIKFPLFWIKLSATQFLYFNFSISSHTQPEILRSGIFFAYHSHLDKNEILNNRKQYFYG